MTRNLVIIAILAFLLPAFTSCEALTIEQHKPKGLISIHSIVKYPRATNLEKEIETYGGKSIWINVNAFINSKVVMSIKTVPIAGDPNHCHLKFTFDKRGIILWNQLSAGFAKRELAFMVDGIFYRTIIAEKVLNMDDGKDDTVIIKGPFDIHTARSISTNSEKNFKFYHKDDVFTRD